MIINKLFSSPSSSPCYVMLLHYLIIYLIQNDDYNLMLFDIPFFDILKNLSICESKFLIIIKKYDEQGKNQDEFW